MKNNKKKCCFISSKETSLVFKSYDACHPFIIKIKSYYFLPDRFVCLFGKSLEHDQAIRRNLTGLSLFVFCDR